jgi:hypothetical protein
VPAGDIEQAVIEQLSAVFRIRIVHRDGRAETLAGGPEKQGYKDGPADQARFKSPHGVAVRNDGAIAVAETKGANGDR